MLSVVTKLFAPRNKETHREKALSNQVDRLEIELARARREREAIQIRLDEERAQFDQHRLRDYPSRTPETLHNEDLFAGQFHNPIDQLLTDVAALGYDVSGPTEMHHATLALIAQYQHGVAQVMASAHALHHNRYVIKPEAVSLYRPKLSATH